MRDFKRLGFLLGVVLLGLAAFLGASPVLAAGPTDYLADMPTVKQVTAAFVGTDTFDTAARQYVAFERLDMMMSKLIGNRDVTGQVTQEERTLRNAYLGGWTGLVSQVTASLPEDQRAFYAGTRFAAWRAQVGHYMADPQFNQQFRSLFPAQFQKTFATLLADMEAINKTAAPPTAPPPAAVQAANAAGAALEAVIRTLLPFALFVIGVMLPFLFKHGRLELDKKDPFHLFVGKRVYDLTHVTGLVTGTSKLATTDVYGGGGGSNASGAVAPVRIYSSTTIHDQFFIEKGDGHKQAIQLSAWNVAVADGHAVSAVWMGDSNFLLENHTTKMQTVQWRWLEKYLLKRDDVEYHAIELLICAGLAIPAAIFMNAFGAFAVAVIGVIVGSLLWHQNVRPGYFARFRRDGLPRMTAALNELAAITARV
jgi:hypothetical protein